MSVGPTLRRRALAAAATFVGCGRESSSLGVLPARDAGAEIVDAHRVAGIASLRCAVSFEGIPSDEIATLPSAESSGLLEDREAIAGGSWTERGSVLIERPGATILVPDARCPGEGLRRVRRVLSLDAGITVDTNCLDGVRGARRVLGGNNNSGPGACVDLSDDMGEAVATVNLVGITSHAPIVSRRPWRESRCRFSDQYLGAIAVDGAGARWFQRYDYRYAQVGAAQALSPLGSAFRPRGLVNSGGGWIAFWQGADAGGPQAIVEQLSLEGASSANQNMASWFEGATSLRVHSVTQAGYGAIALVSVEADARQALYAALVCSDGRHRFRRLLGGAVAWALLVEAGAGLALLVEREADGARTLGVAMADVGLTWRREIHEIARAPSLMLHDATADDDPRFVVVWYSRADDAGSSLRAALVDFGSEL